MNFRKLIYFTGLIFVLNCSKTSGSKISDEFIKKVAVVNDSLPSAYVGYNFYVKINKDSVLITNVDGLYNLYENKYSHNFKDFHKFLDASLKRDFKINVNFIDENDRHLFKLNEKINGMSTESLIQKYFEKDDSNERYYFYPKDLNYEVKQTILYKMFKEGYLISFNDYGGKFIIQSEPLN